MQRMKHTCLVSGLSMNRCLLKALILFCGLTVVICFFYVRRTRLINNNSTDILDRSHSRRHNETNPLNISPGKDSKEIVGNTRRPAGKKIFIAFDYWEQLTKATDNFLDLTALAAYGGRHVVVPFVKDSKFYGSGIKKGFETLALYFNVTALNRTLLSRGHGTLISWGEFQDVCKGQLDVLVHFDYTNLNQTTTYSRGTRAFFPCKDRHKDTFRNFKVGTTICMNVFALDSVEKFENEVVKRFPCVGLAQWRGSDNNCTFRTQFELSSVVRDHMRSHDNDIFFSSKLLRVARDFIVKHLSPLFVSVHIRAERILKFKIFRNITAVYNCISNLTARVQTLQRFRNVSNAASIPVFLAADFVQFGSSSSYVKPARAKAKSLMAILAPLKPVSFQPSSYNLTDRGAVAIVEMNILASAKHLFVVGGGNFQEWVVKQFLHKNNIEQSSAVKCRSEQCNNFCFF
ncbi:hypothetical protein OS493_019037 [Desmophyllum pertusum]|uniref:O-fucosyltransferase family protein n=1 Tax=Desmophyllum pertusum TaxID=174260 RepID=A0A9W9YZJ6_9CNID|nr:hypothetical protein OS493_019037 [Desmophyllum pertusum]